MDDKKSYAPPLQIGDVMTGESIAEVVLSNVPNFAVGDLVLARAAVITGASTDIGAV
jgi:NADPH-dependent curcumin reductase CurA